MALLATPEIPNIPAIPAIFHPQSGHDGLMFPSSFQQIFSISEGWWWLGWDLLDNLSIKTGGKVLVMTV